MNLQEFLNGYIDALLWSSTTDGGESLEFYNLSPEALAKCKADCLAFMEAAASDLALYATTYQPAHGFTVDECAGHDFWLTRCGHGAGFWDRGLGDLGDRLTALCGHGTQFPPLEAYVGDDGKVHLS